MLLHLLGKLTEEHDLLRHFHLAMQLAELIKVFGQLEVVFSQFV